MTTNSTPEAVPNLYGLASTNKDGSFWGKNQFNNAFPMSLACWMRDNGKSFVEIYRHNGEVKHRECSISHLFGLKTTEKPHFDFEHGVQANAELCHGVMPRVDVVISPRNRKNDQRRGLEIKLVVVPDSTTVNKHKSNWAPEIVFRPSTSTNAAILLYRNLKTLGHLPKVRKLLDKRCGAIHDWGNPVEMKSRADGLLETLREIIDYAEESQTPLVACSIWRTEAQTPVLSANAFDIFGWTDTIFLDMVCERAESGRDKGVSRSLRTALRSLKVLQDLVLTGKVNLNIILSTMSFDAQDDKDFAIAGSQTIRYMKHKRLQSPAVPSEALKELILGNGIDNLSPERRLDATLYFAYKYQK